MAKKSGSGEAIYGKEDHGNASEIGNDALSSLGKFSSNTVNGSVKDGRVDEASKAADATEGGE